MKYSHVATTMNIPTGMAKVMMAPAWVQSPVGDTDTKRTINPCTPASCESTHGHSSQAGPGWPGSLVLEQPVQIGLGRPGLLVLQPPDGERHGHDAERDQGEHPQD